jgi:hypothetical protein
MIPLYGSTRDGPGGVGHGNHGAMLGRSMNPPEPTSILIPVPPVAARKLAD